MSNNLNTLEGVTPDAELLQQLIEYEFLDNFPKGSIRSYSGRGMYGRSCLGVVIDGFDIGRLIAHIIRNMDFVKDDKYPGDRGEIADSFEEMCWDSLGLQTVVYFKSVRFIEPPCEDDDEDNGEECLDD
jgi:hypothetical protein